MAKKKAISNTPRPQRTEKVDAGNLSGGKATEFVAVAQSFEGPLPPPAFLKQYDEALPGAADRILVLAESQSKHRMEIEKKLIHADIVDAEKGRQERRLGHRAQQAKWWRSSETLHRAGRRTGRVDERAVPVL